MLKRRVLPALLVGVLALLCAPATGFAAPLPGAHDDGAKAVGAETVGAGGAEAAAVGGATSGEPLTGAVSLYPRAIRLQHNGSANGTIIAAVVTFTGRGGEGAILESTDDGRSFRQVGAIPASQQAGTPGLCCASIYELPSPVGALPAGTLLWAGSVGADAGAARRMTQRVWQSQDRGRTWAYLSTCAESPDTRGMWEPELSVDARGRLVCHFADEASGPAGSQRLARRVSTDGVTWGPIEVTVQSRPGAFRPGMPVVRRLPDASYLMVYEICGVPGQYDCAVYSRTSPDGEDWGDPADSGQRLVAASGRYFTHTPTIAVVPRPNGDARIVLVGQLLQEPDGPIAPGNGATLMVNERSGRGPWYEVPAPVAVPDAYNNYCPNYSSTLVPSRDGRDVLEVATAYAEDGACKSYFATGRLGPRSAH